MLPPLGYLMRLVINCALICALIGALICVLIFWGQSVMPVHAWESITNPDKIDGIRNPCTKPTFLNLREKYALTQENSTKVHQLGGT
jgi:hypothetical protein